MQPLIPAYETLEIEFKSDIQKLSDSDLIDAVVAFANTVGGDLYLGVEDDGTVTGLHKQHLDTIQVAAFIANRTVPPVAVRISMLHAEKPVLLIQVPKSRSIVASTNGKILRRRIKADGKPENIPMYPYEISTRLSDLSLLDFSAQPVPGATYQDFDPLERERLRKILLAYHGEKNLLELPDEDMDKALQLVTMQGNQLIPTYTGLLLLGKAEKIKELVPTAESAFIALRGTEVTTNESFFLPLLSAIERMIELVDARNPEQEMELGMFRVSIPDFDHRSVREAIVNAFAHRDYTQLGRVLVKLDSDGLTISNPGGFIEGVTIENILDAEPHGRNPALADALKRIGLAERSGRGVDRIFVGSLQYGRNVPDYTETTSRTVKLFIPRSMPDKGIASIIAKEERRTGLPMSLSDLLTLNALKEKRKMSLSDISAHSNVPEAKLRATLERLTEAGVVEGFGNGRGRTYVLSPKVYKDSIKYVRQTDIDQLRYKELILKLAQKKHTITRADVIELLHVSGPQAYRLLNKLVQEGELERRGNTSASKYSLSKRE